MKHLKFSAAESEILGLRIARGTARFGELDLPSLKEEIVRDQLDLCKIKVSAGQKAVFCQLDDLGFPYQIASVLYRNKKVITQADGSLPLPEGLAYEHYDGSQLEELSHLVASSIGTPTGVNFHILPVDGFIDPQRQLRLSIDYVIKALPGKEQKLQVWLLRQDGVLVGFFMGTVQVDAFEGTLCGVPPEFRGRGYGNWINNIMKRVCWEQGLKYCYTDIQVQNPASQKGALQGGFEVQGLYFHVFIFPFLHYASLTNDKHLLGSFNDNGQMLSQVFAFHEKETVPKSHQLQGLKQVNIQESNPIDTLYLESDTIQQEDGRMLILNRILDDEGVLQKMLYLTYAKPIL